MFFIPMGIAEKVALTTRFLSRKMEEYEAHKLAIDALKSEVSFSKYVFPLNK